MAERSLKPSADAPGDERLPTLSFEGFALDLARAELRRDGQVVPLRPKAFDLMAALAARPSQVLTKEQLMQAVWPGVVVTDDSLTQCVHELRQALGERGAELIRTVPRRGYRFDAEPVSVGGRRPDDDADRTGPDVPEAAGAWGAAASATSAAPAVPGPAVPHRPGRHRRRVVAGAFAVVVPAVALTWFLTSHAPAWRTPHDLATPLSPRDWPALSILVLPFATQGSMEPAAAWLADALHGDLVSALARLQDSHVIARDTAATYRDRPVDARQAAREMGVRHVVSGRLRQEGSQIGLEFVLIDGETGVQRWTGSFDTDRASLAQAVGDFAVAIERTLVGELVRTNAARAAALSPTEVGADDLAMQGYARWYRGVTRENVLAARALFERAIELDAASVRAWSGLQFTTANLLLNHWADDRAAVLARHHEALGRLEHLDRDGNQAYSAKTFMLFSRRDFPAMLRNTTEWTSRHRLPLAFGAHGGALLFNGRFDDAVPAIERALRLGPRDPFRAEWQYRLALAHWAAGRYALARDWSRAAAHTTPTLVWPPIHAAAMHRLGRTTEARQALAEHIDRHPGYTAAQVVTRVPGDDPALVEMRERLVASLRELGLR